MFMWNVRLLNILVKREEEMMGNVLLCSKNSQGMNGPGIRKKTFAPTSHTVSLYRRIFFI